MTPTGTTVLLSRSDIARLATVGDYFDAMSGAFRAHAEGRVASPMPMQIDGRNGAFHAKGAAMECDGKRLAAIKLNANFPKNRDLFGLPTIQGAILLCDAETGVILAILDSAEITLRRTAAASAVALEALARKDAATLLICGCGVQGRAHAEALSGLRRFTRILLFDKDQARAAGLAAQLSAMHGGVVEAATDLGEAAARSEVIVTSTPSESAILLPSHVRPGAFIAAVGADNPHKNEIAPGLMRRAAIIADVREQCAVMGDLRAAIEAGALTRDAVRADLGEVLTGARPGRTSDDEIVIFDSTGAAFQDLAAAVMIVARARAAGAGRHVSLDA